MDTRTGQVFEAPKYALSKLTAETLAELCDQFRAEVFKKAGIIDPANQYRKEPHAEQE